MSELLLYERNSCGPYCILVAQCRSGGDLNDWTSKIQFGNISGNCARKRGSHFPHCDNKKWRFQPFSGTFGLKQQLPARIFKTWWLCFRTEETLPSLWKRQCAPLIWTLTLAHSSSKTSAFTWWCSREPNCFPKVKSDYDQKEMKFERQLQSVRGPLPVCAAGFWKAVVSPFSPLSCKRSPWVSTQFFRGAQVILRKGVCLFFLDLRKTISLSFFIN